jgi:hypothetical protein
LKSDKFLWLLLLNSKMQEHYYHGSQNPDLTILEPRMRKRRNDQTGPRLYVAPSIGIAAVFIPAWDDRFARFGRFGGGPWTLEIYDRSKFLDDRGWVYTVDNEGAIPVQDGTRELYFETPKLVLARLEVPSALELIAQEGIRIMYKEKSA